VRVGGRAGFTLIETAVALALTAIVLAALAGAVSRTARAHGATTDRARRSALVRAALLRMGDELEAADPGQRFEIAAGTLRFGTFGRADGEPLALTYRLDLPTATLSRRDAPPRSRPDERAPVPVLEGVDAFRVRALDPDGWHDDWQSDTLPRAIEITLTLGTEDLALRIALPAAP
jgi:prepilin-type N-terminal cleavage/methylation domain-containing protein